jgi:CubicO group peptidase (beta-lactamase class C family)
MIGRLFALLGISILLTASAAADPIDDYMSRQMERGHIPGAAIAIVENGKVSTARAYGLANLEWNIPVDGDTAFQLASATKLFTGAVLMRLVEREQISLDGPISSFFEDAPESWRKITVLQLANHSSGLSEDLGNPRPETVNEIVAASMRAPLAYEPGTQSRYGFTDFVVLRAILEKVSGKKFEELIQDEIAAPLGLKSTRFAHMANNEMGIRSYDVLPRRASIYSSQGSGQRGSEFFYGETGHAAGGIYSSINDLAAFFAAIDNGRLLSRESVAALQTAAIFPSGKANGFGVGWSVRKYRGVPVVGHSGGPALADIVRIPDRKLTIIAVTNQQNLYPLIAEGIADFYLPAPPERSGIADKNPEGARRVREMLTSALQGQLDKASFNEGGRANMVPFLQGFGQTLLKLLGPVQSVRLLADDEAGGLRTRRYRINFETRPMEWLLETDGQGLIQGIYPVGES